MIVFRSPKLQAYVTVAALGFASGLVLHRPEPVLLAVPFLVALALGLPLAQIPQIELQVSLPQTLALEGDTVPVEVTALSGGAVAQADILVRLPPGLAWNDGPPISAAQIKPHTPCRIQRTISCQHWGGFAIGEVYCRARDPLGFFAGETYADRRVPLRVYPRPATVRSLVRPAETQIFAGNELSRAHGDGIEFIDVRPFIPGDRVRRVNWRLSTRRQTLFVNEFHQERNTDIILFLDTFAGARRGHGHTLDDAVRGAAALADRYLEHRDRVGLVSFGGLVRWLRPAMGAMQRYQIIESLIDTDIALSFAWKEITVIPMSVLPPQSLILALTPLLDERTIRALFDLRARHFDVAVIELAPDSSLSPPSSASGQIAWRIWELERELLRDQFRRQGIAVGVWNSSQLLEAVIQEVQAFRRYARRAPASSSRSLR
jgi:uncharacterized protein (DUF58 family)